MNLPLDSLHLSLKEFETADQKTKQLAAFCAELLEAIKYTLEIIK